jgi:TolB protein
MVDSLHPEKPTTAGGTAGPAPFRIALSALGLLLAACQAAPATPDPAATAPTQTEAPTPTSTPTIAPSQTPYIVTATPPGPVAGPVGLFFLSLGEAGRDRLFAYAPDALPLTRLTAGDWDDRDPSLSPDGRLLAFASDRNGYWNLWLLDLETGATSQLTDNPEYEGAPSWSPDGVWLTYESFVQDNLEIFIHSVADPTQAATQLTLEDSLDSSPVWSPLGRQIAFVSNRGGEPEVWIADLDRTGADRLINISRSPETVESHPAWSPDGTRLAWASLDPAAGLSGIRVWDARSPQAPGRWLGAGDLPAWQGDDLLAGRLEAPNATYLAGYAATAGTITIPPLLLPGPLRSLSHGITSRVVPGAMGPAAQLTPAALFNSQTDPLPGVPGGRASLVDLSGVQAPYPQLHELADDPFQALRGQVAAQLGWDALASLENAYVPLTTPLQPGLGADWLYTGRAFTLNPALIEAGYMVVVREEFGGQTYWRIFLRATAQDGSQGVPLSRVPWDLAARTGSSASYEQGGRLMEAIPTGYWLDLTALAIQFRWERLPALTNWRTYYGGARFNELVFTQGLDWRTAMLQLYPPEALVTPTLLIPPTRTWTRTPLWYRSPTPSRTPTPGPTHTP